MVSGGDQLTRSRLQEAKALRSLSPNPKKRFEVLDPIVIELWHLKHDVLEVYIQKILWSMVFIVKSNKRMYLYIYIRKNYTLLGAFYGATIYMSEYFKKVQQRSNFLKRTEISIALIIFKGVLCHVCAYTPTVSFCSLYMYQ